MHARSLQSCSTVTLRTVAHRAPLSMGFFRQDYWSGLPCPPPGDLPDPGIEPESHYIYLYWQMGSLPLRSDQIRWVTQSCPTLCNPMDCNLPGSSVHGILQARLLEWVAIPFSRESSRLRDQTWVSCIAGRFFIIWATKEVVIREESSPCSGWKMPRLNSNPNSVSTGIRSPFPLSSAHPDAVSCSPMCVPGLQESRAHSGMAHLTEESELASGQVWAK